MVIMKYFVGLLLVMVSADQNSDSYIFKGQEAKDGQFPYHVGIYVWLPKHKKKLYNCGGSLISETFIVTAAHCLDEYATEDLTAFLGSRHILQGTEKPARNKIVHSGFDWVREHGNDIGLLEIDRITYSDTIRNINLPPFSDLNLSYEADIAVISGWGLKNSSLKAPRILQYTHLLVISNTACGKANNMDIPNKIMCAADPDGSACCKGDSGGPLVDTVSKNLIGIVSFGPSTPCDIIHFGTAFTRVASFRQWIYDNTGI